jgi:Flp pilus assembly protein TadG
MPSSTASDPHPTTSQQPPAAERGQAAVEFAVVLPMILLMSLGLVVVAVAVRNEFAVGHAAHEGARAAAVSAVPSAAGTAAAQRAVELPIDVSVRDDGDTVTVTVTHVDRVDVPLIGRLVGPVRHVASVTMTLEPP